MALTPLVIASNRLLNEVFLGASVTLVPADAAINERFSLPGGFGDLALHYAECTLSAFSGAYVAPAPAYDGAKIGIIDSQQVSNIDSIGAGRFVHYSSPVTLIAAVELYRRTVFRLADQMICSAPIVAGAGVTVTLTCRVRGIRLKNS